jgi:hypothetical protein
VRRSSSGDAGENAGFGCLTHDVLALR